MALSDCIECWQTPCECGHEYKFYAQEGREKLTKAINGFSLKELFKFLEKEKLLNVSSDQAFDEVKKHFKYRV